MSSTDQTVGEFEQKLVSDIRDAGITPATRRIIIYTLGAIAALAIVAEVLIVLLGEVSSEALLTVAATAVGGVAGLAIPDRDG